MRIYLFAEHFPNAFKPYYDSQIAQLIDDGHEVRVFAFGRFDASRNAIVDRYGLDQLTTYLPSTLRTLPAAAPSLLRDAAARPWSLVHALAAGVDRGQPAKRSLLDVARGLRLPEAPPDLCLVHNLATAGSFGFLARLYATARVALYFHGGEIPNGGRVAADDARRAFARVHRVFTNTAYSRDEAIRRGCPAEKIAILPVGFRLDEYRPPARKRYRRGGVLRLVTVGRAAVEKGLEHALAAAARLKARGVDRFRLRIVGAGPQLAALRARAAADRLAPQVEFCGELPHHALAAEYLDADALILPSVPTPRWEENQACAMQEAMLMKLLVVATRTGGVQESLAPALRRFSVEPFDAEAIAARVEELLALPEDALRRLGAAGREFAERGYDLRALNRRLLTEAMRLGALEAPAAGLAQATPA